MRKINRTLRLFPFREKLHIVYDGKDFKRVLGTPDLKDNEYYSSPDVYDIPLNISARGIEVHASGNGRNINKFIVYDGGRYPIGDLVELKGSAENLSNWSIEQILISKDFRPHADFEYSECNKTDLRTMLNDLHLHIGLPLVFSGSLSTCYQGKRKVVHVFGVLLNQSDSRYLDISRYLKCIFGIGNIMMDNNKKISACVFGLNISSEAFEVDIFTDNIDRFVGNIYVINSMF